MEQLLDVLTNLSSVIGVPAALCLAWAAFVIRDHAKRIQKLEDDLEEANKARSGELNVIYERINGMSGDVAYIKGVLSERYKQGGSK